MKGPGFSSAAGPSAVLFIACLVLLFSGCQTATDVVMSAPEAEERAALDEAALDLLRYRRGGQSEGLAAAERRVSALERRPGADRSLNAAALGLSAEILFLKGEVDGIPRLLQRIEGLNRREERLFIVRALLAGRAMDREHILRTGLAEADTTAEILLRLGELYFDTARFREAAAAFDDAFMIMNPAFRPFFERTRELAHQNMRIGPSSTDVRELLAKETLSLADVLVITNRETTFLERLTADRNADARLLHEQARAAGYLAPDAAIDPNAPLRRRDLAFFLARLISILERNPDITRRYDILASQGRPSPVPDLRPTDSFFSAALTMVEREILELPDGRRFFPEQFVSGSKYAGILERLRRLYR